MNYLIRTLYLVVLVIGCSACVRQPVPDQLPPADPQLPLDLAVIEREQWGWQPGEKTLPEHTIDRITIHHGGVDFPDDKDPVAYLKALQSWSRSDKEWIDIPYHYMIDRQGRIYEARPVIYPGDTNTTYDPTGHVLIAVMGDYNQQELGQIQIDALIATTAWLAQEFGVAVEDIRGHKDYAETTCPGDDIYRLLEDDSIRRRVQASLNL